MGTSSSIVLYFSSVLTQVGEVSVDAETPDAKVVVAITAEFRVQHLMTTA